MNKIVFYLCCAFSVLLFSCSKQDEVEKLTPVINISVEGDVIALGNEASVNSYAIHIDYPIKGRLRMDKNLFLIVSRNLYLRLYQLKVIK